MSRALTAQLRSYKTIDAVLDSGANNHFFNTLANITDYKPSQGTLQLGDNTKVPTIGTGKFGTLDVVIAPSLTVSLISTKCLTINKKFVVTHIDDRAFILSKKYISNNNPEKYIKATATVQDDGLYHIDNIHKFLNVKHICNYTCCYTKRTKPYTAKEILHGSARNDYTATTVGLNPLEVLHVKLGHANEKLIKWIVKHNIVLGLGYTHDDVKNLTLKLCPSCMTGRMHAFPIPMSISNKEYGIFELLSVDIVVLNKTSLRGFKYTALYVDKCTSKVFPYHMALKSELLDTLKLIISEHGKERNPRSLHLRFLQADSGTEALSNEFTAYLSSSNIQLQVAAPHKHQQVLVERYVATVKNGLRTILAYNNAPVYYWCYAMDYYCYTFNNLPRAGKLTTRNEDFTGEKSDMSIAVPFYAEGYYHISPEERLALRHGKAFNPRGRRCRMLGYAGDANIATKNSYQCLIYGTTNSVLIRHDCYFKHYTDDEPSLLSAEVNQRDQSSFVPPQAVDYDELLDNDQYNEFSNAVVQRTAIIDADGASSSTVKHSSPYAKALEVMQKALTDWKPDKGTTDDSSRNAVLQMFTTAASNSSKSNSSKYIAPTARKLPPAGAAKSTRSTRPVSKSTKHPKQSESNTRYPHRERKSTERLAYHTELLQMQADINEGEHARKPLPLPTSLEEAFQGPEAHEWFKAYTTEMQRIIDRNTFDICSDDIQSDDTKKAIKSKFAFRLTRKPDGTLKYKVRLVACGYSQVYGRDYLDTYAPTAKYKSFCIVMQLAAVFGWIIKGIDVENAYLESDIDKPILMYLPHDVYRTPHGKSIKTKLNLSLYGLKQAGELWNRLLNEKFITLEFTRLAHDQCTYIHRDDETGAVTIIIVYVDDIIFTGNDETKIDYIIDYLASEFTKLTELGEITRYIGVDLQRDTINDAIMLSQVPFTKSYLESAATADMKPKSVPLNPTVDYRVPGNTNNDSIQEPIGKLRYLADRTKPELLFSVGILASTAAHPSDTHLQGLKHITRYLLDSKEDYLTLGGEDKTIKLFGFSDASYIPHADSKSQLAYCFFLNLTSGTICARTKKDTTVSHSSAEAEVKALDMAIVQAVWLRGFLAELGYEQKEATVIYTDSLSAKVLAETFNLSNNSAHLVMRLNYIHQEIVAGNIILKYIDTQNQVADILTKALPVAAFKPLKHKLLHGFSNQPIEAKLKIKKVKMIKKNKVQKKLKFA